MEFYYNSRSEELEVVLPGSSRGTGSELIGEIFQKIKDEDISVVMMDYPFHNRLEKKGFGEKVTEEVEALTGLLEYCRAREYKKVRLIGKSLGGVVAGRFLAGLSRKDQEKFELIVLGYDLGWIDIRDFAGKIMIVQGSEDPFGGIELVKKDMGGAASVDVTYKEIQGADHGFREPKTGKPKYFAKVFDVLIKGKD